MANTFRNAPLKSRFFSCVTYCSTQELEYILEKKRPLIKDWAYILHHSDTYTEIDYTDYQLLHNNEKPEWNVGDPKKPHIHALIRLYSPITLECFRRLYKPSEDNITAQFVMKEQSVKEYLIHEGLPFKYQYDISEVKTSNLDWFLGKAEAEPKKDKANEILDLLNQGAKPWDIASVYGREFILNFRKYYEFYHFVSGYEFDELYKEYENERRQALMFKQGEFNTTATDLKVIDEEISRLIQLRREKVNADT